MCRKMMSIILALMLSVSLFPGTFALATEVVIDESAPVTDTSESGADSSESETIEGEPLEPDTSIAVEPPVEEIPLDEPSDEENNDEITEDIVDEPAEEPAGEPALTAEPNGGEVTKGTKVTLSTDIEGAKIRYTRGGKDPTVRSPLYKKPITVTKDTIIKAIVVMPDKTVSEVVELDFTLKAMPVTASQPDGVIVSGNTVKLKSKTNRAAIHYTTDGTEPTAESEIYTKPIEITSDVTIKTVALKDGIADSDITTFTYTMPPKIEEFPKADYISGALEKGTKVTLSTDIEDAQIRYTTNGKEPTAKSRLYKKPIRISKATTIRAIIVKKGMTESDIAAFEYTVYPKQKKNSGGIIGAVASFFGFGGASTFSTFSEESKFLAEIEMPNTEDFEVHTISNLEDFQQIRDDISVGDLCYYVLQNDIDLNGIEWEPIGDNDKPFEGIFDGQGHAIKNLTINNYEFGDSLTGYVGLFGYIGNSGIVKNVGLEDTNINVSSPEDLMVYVGGICGENLGEIYNCYNIGDVFAKVNDNATVGGISGSNSCSITYSYNGRGNITSDLHSGGISGANFGNIAVCYNEGNISSDDEYVSSVGGISSWNAPDGVISNCFSTGKILAKAVSNNAFEAVAGGICGYNIGEITNSYATGDVIAEIESEEEDFKAWAGGICGSNFSDINDTKYGTIKNSVTLAESIVASATTGGDKKTYLISNMEGTKTSILALNNLSGSFEDDSDTELTLISPADAKKQTTYTTLGWDFNTVWTIDENNAYPQLKAFVATPEPPVGTYEIKVEVGTGGGGAATINSSAEPTVTPSDTDATANLVATPDEGYRFDGWYKDGESTPISTSTSYTYTTNDSTRVDTVFVANFIKKTYAITVAAQGNGTVTGFNASKVYEHGDTFTLTATPDDSSYRFDKWSVGSNDIYTNPNTFTSISDMNIVAKFVSNTTPYTINVSAETGGSLTSLTGAGSHNPGVQVAVNLDVNVHSGYRFDGWYENGVKKSSSGTNYSDTITSIDKNINYVAKFIKTYQIAATAGTGGFVSGSNTYDQGEQVTLTATAALNYTFDGWYENNNKLTGAGATYTFNATGNRTLEARFTLVQTASPSEFTITVIASPSSYGKVTGGDRYESNVASVDIKATPNSGYKFDGWYEHGAKISSSRTLTITTKVDRTFTAYFSVDDSGSGGSGGGSGSGSGGSSGSGNNSGSYYDYIMNQTTLQTSFLINGNFMDATIGYKSSSYTLDIKAEKNSDGTEKPAEVTISAGLLSNLFNETKDNEDVFVINVRSDYGIYKVPVNLTEIIPNFQALLKQHGLRADEIDFKITVSNVTSSSDISRTIYEELPGAKVLSQVIDFHIEMINKKTGKTISGANSFTTPISREIPISGNLPEKWCAAKFNEDTRTFRYVAHKEIVRDGKKYVEISSYSNSRYLILDNPVTFSDVESNKWYQPTVLKAASKLLVQGEGDGRFVPERQITRAEFVHLLMNAFSLPDADSSTKAYSDLDSNKWYYSSVMKAKAAGLFRRMPGDNFNPDQPITREEMASILSSTATYLGIRVPNMTTDISVKYADYKNIDALYRNDVYNVVAMGLMQGVSGTTFNPKGVVDRAQAATVMVNILTGWGML